MTTTPYSYRSYTGDGSTDTFAVPFPYLKRAHVSVKVADALQTDGTDYDWTSDTQIKFKADKVPASAAAIVVERDTPESDQIVQWADGSYIVAEDLNESDLQWLYNIQELEDQVSDLDGTVEGEAVKSISGVEPIQVDTTDNQTPVISIDETDSDDNPNQLTSDTRVMSEKAVDDAFKQHIGTSPTTGNKLGQIRIDDTGATPQAFYWNGTSWVQLTLQGPEGPQGPAGPAPGLQDPAATATSVSLNEDGTLGTPTANVQQDPGTGDLQFLFGLPVGQKGDKGDTGADSEVPGPPPGLQDPAATVTSVPNKADGSVGDPAASVTQDGSGDLQFAFGIPVGAKGDKGDPGDGIDYKGSIDATTAAEPSNSEGGDLYVNVADGNSSWTGLGAVIDGSRLIYNAHTNQWDSFDPSYSTDLGYTTATNQGTVTNSNGTDAVLPLVDTTNAGLMAPGDKTKLDGIADGAQVNPDLSTYLQREDNVSLLENDAGYITADDIPASASTLQEVLDNGNTSTTDLFIGESGATVRLANTGSVVATANGGASFTGLGTVSQAWNTTAAYTAYRALNFGVETFRVDTMGDIYLRRNLLIGNTGSGDDAVEGLLQVSGDVRLRKNQAQGTPFIACNQLQSGTGDLITEPVFQVDRDGGVTASFGTDTVQRGNVMPRDDWSSIPSRTSSGGGGGGGGGTPTVTVTSSSFTAGGAIATRFYYDQDACPGANDSPQLAWDVTNLPAGATITSFALIVTDPDGGDWIHWLVEDIVAGQTSIEENNQWQLGAVVRDTSYAPGLVRVNGWGGPCPPPGETHTYNIVVTANYTDADGDAQQIQSAALTFTASAS